MTRMKRSIFCLLLFVVFRTPLGNVHAYSTPEPADREVTCEAYAQREFPNTNQNRVMVDIPAGAHIMNTEFFARLNSARTPDGWQRCLGATAGICKAYNFPPIGYTEMQDDHRSKYELNATTNPRVSSGTNPVAFWDISTIRLAIKYTMPAPTCKAQHSMLINRGSVEAWDVTFPSASSLSSNYPPNTPKGTVGTFTQYIVEVKEPNGNWKLCGSGVPPGPTEKSVVTGCGASDNVEATVWHIDDLAQDSAGFRSECDVRAGLPAGAALGAVWCRFTYLYTHH